MSIRQDYDAALSDLTFNSKPIINSLTTIAGENATEYANDIADVIIDKIYKAKKGTSPLPIVYLMDSIMKNVGGSYVPLFERSVVDMVAHLFRRADDKTRYLIGRLRDTWGSIFHPSVLERVDVAIGRIRVGQKSVEASQLLQQQQQQHHHHVQTPMLNPHQHHDMGNHFQQQQQQIQHHPSAYQQPQQQPLHTSVTSQAGTHDIILQAQQSLLNPLLDPASRHAIQQRLDMLTSLVSGQQRPPPPIRQQQQSFPVLRSNGEAPRSNAPAVGDLLNQLTSAGLLSAIPTPNSLPKPMSASIVQPMSIKTPPPVTITSLNEYIPARLTSLYEELPLQCTTCARRWPKGALKELSEHHDWHFRQNRRLGDRLRKSRSRSWYLPEDSWVMHKEVEAAEERAPAFFSVSATGEDGDDDDSDVPAKGNVVAELVPASDNSEDCCSMCKDKIEQYWNDDEEHWFLRGAVRVTSDEIAHAACIGGSVAVKRNASIRPEQDDRASVKRLRIV